MNGLIRRGAPAACLTVGLALVGGCDVYRNLVDPCYPQRYEYAARQEIEEAMAPQVYNGHVLDQTVWNYHFEPGTDKLTVGGQEHLAYLARRRPCPDGIVYLQTAQDLRFDQQAPDKYAEARTNLDNKRVQAVQSYLVAQTAGRHLNFEVVVHDPGEVGLSGNAAGVMVLKLYTGFQGNLPSAQGAGQQNVAGGGGAGGAPGGAGR
jgi:hypothetical protein